jgi:hypothetical protein
MLEAAAGVENILKAIRRSDLNSDDALRIVQALKDRDLIDIAAVKSGKGTVLFTEFLETFWDYTASPYVKEKLAHGHSIGKKHCYDRLNSVRFFYDEYFAGRPINSITRQDLKQFSLFLSEKREKPTGHKGHFAEKLSASSINKILIAGTTALSWAFREGLIPHDPTDRFVRFSETPEKRAYVGSLLACTTGMRSGEFIAVQERGLKPPDPGLLQCKIFGGVRKRSRK